MDKDFEKALYEEQRLKEVVKTTMDAFAYKNEQKYGKNFLDTIFLAFIKEFKYPQSLKIDMVKSYETRLSQYNEYHLYPNESESFRLKKALNSVMDYWGGRQYFEMIKEHMEEIWLTNFIQNFQKFEKDYKYRKFFSPAFDFQTYFNHLDGELER